ELCAGDIHGNRAGGGNRARDAEAARWVSFTAQGEPIGAAPPRGGRQLQMRQDKGDGPIQGPDVQGVSAFRLVAQLHTFEATAGGALSVHGPEEPHLLRSRDERLVVVGAAHRCVLDATLPVEKVRSVVEDGLKDRLRALLEDVSADDESKDVAFVVLYPSWTVVPSSIRRRNGGSNWR